MPPKKSWYDCLLSSQPGGYVKGEKWSFRVVRSRTLIAITLTMIFTLPLTMLLIIGVDTSAFITEIKAWHIYFGCFLFCLLVVFFVPYFSRNAHWSIAQF